MLVVLANRSKMLKLQEKPVYREKPETVMKIIILIFSRQIVSLRMANQTT